MKTVSCKRICCYKYALFFIMDSGLWARSDDLKLEWWMCFSQTHSFSSSHCEDIVTIDGLERCGLHADNCDVFISCMDSHSDGTHSLQRIHWWASDVMLYFSESVLTKKQTHLHIGWPKFQQMFIFGQTYKEHFMLETYSVQTCASKTFLLCKIAMQFHMSLHSEMCLNAICNAALYFQC